MSSTRRAKGDSIFHQDRYASSPELERGLIANLVARRCSVLTDKADRELVWFIQYLSHQAGGVAGVAAGLIQKFSDRLGTPVMVKLAKRKSQSYSALEVKKIRQEIPHEFRSRFALRGETKNDLKEMCLPDRYKRLRQEARNARHLRELADEVIYRSGMMDEGRQAELEATEDMDREEARKNPVFYPASVFYDLCRQGAHGGAHGGAGGDPNSLDKELCRLCLDPAFSLSTDAPWYFSELVNVLREFQKQWVEDESKVVITALGRKVYDALDFTLQSRSLSLLEGNARLGKSFACRAWCEQHPGRARFVEVPPGNDDASFFRALARGLGLGNFLNYKVVEIRERVESVLLTGDILLLLDEAQRLWPQRNLRYGFPGRIVWVMTMANAGVPICMVSTPQFIQAQKAVEKTGWNSEQLTGRIGHYEFLPAQLEDSDLMAVGRAVLPEASGEVLKALAIYARTSARYLAAVDSIAKRAQYLAQLNGHANCTTDDVRTAMKESVIPSDTMLLRTLEQGKKVHSDRPSLSMAAAQAENTTQERPARSPSITIAAPTTRVRGDVSLMPAES